MTTLGYVVAILAVIGMFALILGGFFDGVGRD